MSSAMIKTVAILFILCALPPFTIHARANDNPDWDAMVQFCVQAREIETRLRQTPDVNERKAIAEKALAEEIGEEWEQRVAESPGGAFLLLWKMRLHSFADQHEDVRRMALILAGERAIAPEVWKGMIDTAISHEIRSKLEVQLGRMLPVSLFGQIRNARESEYLYYAFANQPIIPALNRDRMFRVAELTERVGNPKQARGAWLEYIYGAHVSHLNMRGIGRDGWLSETTGGAWLRLAELEYGISGYVTASDYLAKAMAFGSDEHFIRGKEIIDRWKLEDAERAIDEMGHDVEHALADDFEVEDVLRLAMLYKELNLHPRSIVLLQNLINAIDEIELQAERHPDANQRLIDGDTKAKAQKMLEEYGEEWIKLVKHRNMGMNKAILFGQPADTEEQIRNIVIPPILQDDVIAEIAAKLPEIMQGGEDGNE